MRGTGKTVSHNTRPSAKLINIKLKDKARKIRRDKKLAREMNRS
jgi:hypothetical protein